MTDVLTPAGQGISRPRIVVGGDKRLAAITNPTPGLTFVHLERSRVLQWIGDHWEIIAEGTVGKPPWSKGDMEALDIEGQSGYSALSGDGGLVDAIGGLIGGGDPDRYTTPIALPRSIISPGGGGGGISPSPRLSTDPPLSSAMVGSSDVPFYGTKLFLNNNIVTAAAPSIVLNPVALDTVDIDTVPPQRVGSTIVINKAGRWRVTAKASLSGSTTQYLMASVRIRLNGTAVSDGNQVKPNDAAIGGVTLTPTSIATMTLAVGDILAARLDATLVANGDITTFSGTNWVTYLEAEFLGTV